VEKNVIDSFNRASVILQS